MWAKPRKGIVAAILMFLAISSSSCVYLVVGGLGALGGYVVSPDTVEGIVSFDQDTMWESAVEVTSIMGVIDEKSREGGIIISTIQKVKVTINILPINSSAVKLSVKARRRMFPKIKMAQDIYIKIMSRVEGIDY